MSTNQSQLSHSGSPDRLFWIVSPNVQNNPKTVEAWKAASVSQKAAFMGYGPHEMQPEQIGPKFAGTATRGVKPGNVILIARRHKRQPEIVGFGVVQGEYATKIKAFKPPEDFGSLRSLSPFKVWTEPPPGIPLMPVLEHTKALAQLHPDWEGYAAHKKVCEWLDRELSLTATEIGKEEGTMLRPRGRSETTHGVTVVDQFESHQLDYKVQTKAKIIQAKNIEFKLLKGYRGWLRQQGRNLGLAKYGKLRCDGYEEQRKNLIEAKASTSRGHVRMAVGQLLDYAFQGEEKLGKPHKAILLPAKIDPDIEKWLRHLDISIIWREGESFVDNANGQFA